MKMKRRDFLAAAAVGAGGAVMGLDALAPAAEAGKTFDPYEPVPLGKTGLKLSRVGLGTGMRGGMRRSNQTRLGKKRFDALIRGAHERGVRWYDLADLYGSHEFFATSLKGIPRQKYVIVSKIWWRPRGLPEKARPDADVVVRRFLKELKTDYIDLVLLHCVTSPKWPEQLREQMDILAELKRKEVIRAHGVSCHSLPALAACIDEPWVDSVHARINPYGVRMDDKPEKVAPVLRRIHDSGKGVVGMKIIGEGKFAKSPQARSKSVEYSLGLGCVDTLLVGFEKTAQIDDVAGRIRDVPRSANAG